MGVSAISPRPNDVLYCTPMSSVWWGTIYDPDENLSYEKIGVSCPTSFGE